MLKGKSGVRHTIRKGSKITLIQDVVIPIRTEVFGESASQEGRCFSPRPRVYSVICKCKVMVLKPGTIKNRRNLP